jgi:2-polyprenyl-3-methyl-5-hydroxy-6-metoxy-1,4-benzoquinol methylase
MLQLEESLKTPATEIAIPRTAPVDACPLCNEKESIALFSAPDRLHGTPGTFQYRRCKSCRTVFQDPRVIPDDLALCYPADYFTHIQYNGGNAVSDPSNQARQLSGIRDAIRQAVVASVKGVPLSGKIGLIGRVLASSRYVRERAFYNLVSDLLLPRAPGVARAMDVGCGAGHLMAKLQRAGWTVEGIEWDPEAAAVARRNSRCRVYDGDFRSVKLPLASYHLIVLSHVLEHLDDPLSALTRIRDLLMPDGRVVLFYPNPESLGARLFGGAWFPWEVPRHLVLPTAEALSDKAGEVGLRLICKRSSNREAEVYSAISRVYKTGKTIDPKNIRVDLYDQFVKIMERAMTAIGINVGEENILVLQKL